MPDAWTVSVWAAVPQDDWAKGDNWNALWGWSGDANNRVEVRYESGSGGLLRFHWRIDGNSTYKTLTTDDPTPFEWFHVVVTYDGAYANIWLNGVQVITNQALSNAWTVTPNSISFGDTPFTNGFWNGWADDAIVLDRALTDEEAYALYKSGVPMYAG